MTDEELLAILARLEHGWSQAKATALRELLDRKVDFGLIGKAVEDGTLLYCPHDRYIYRLCSVCDTEDPRGRR